MTKSYDINKVMKRLYYDAMRGNPQSAKALIELQNAKVSEEHFRDICGFETTRSEQIKKFREYQIRSANLLIEKYPILKDELYNPDGSFISDPFDEDHNYIISNRLRIFDLFWEIDSYITEYNPYVCIRNPDNPRAFGNWVREDNNIIAKLQTIYKFELHEIPKPTYQRSGDKPGTKPY